MKKYISLAAGLVLFTVSACTQSTPVTDNATPTKVASPTATSSEKPLEKPTSTAKVDDKNAAGWQDYKSSAGKFSVQLPSKPQEQSQDQTTDVGTIKLNMVIAESNDSG